MQARSAFGIAALLALLAPAGPAAAHSPVCNCYHNGDGTVTCEGGFSDGSSAEGVAISVVDARDRVLLAGKMDAVGTFSFERPDADFHVVFDAGQGHAVTIYGADIEE